MIKKHFFVDNDMKEGKKELSRWLDIINTKYDSELNDYLPLENEPWGNGIRKDLNDFLKTMNGTFYSGGIKKL